MTDIKYNHTLSNGLDGELQCSCGESFTKIAEAGAHFIATTELAVRNQTGWRGLWNRLRPGAPRSSDRLDGE